MEFTQSVTGNRMELVLSGKFTFADHEMFRSIITIIKEKSSPTIALDLGGVEFVDSAALGMLLIAREESEKSGVEVVLCNPAGQIEKMLKVSKFDSLFKIE